MQFYDTLTVEEAACLDTIGKASTGKARSLASKLADKKNYDGPTIFYYGENNVAITGQSGVEAARMLMDTDRSLNGIFDYKDLQVPAVDVGPYIEEYCAMNDCSFHQIPFDKLRSIFRGTDIEDQVSQCLNW